MLNFKFNALLGKLKGPARNCTYGHTFESIDDHLNHLKKRLAPGKIVRYYMDKINSLRMHQGERIGSLNLDAIIRVLPII